MNDDDVRAFPRPAVFTATHGLASPEQDGMTLRDYFAAKWLQGWTANSNIVNTDAKTIASCAYDIADAMLEARKKNK
jgi:hypothetical protein